MYRRVNLKLSVIFSSVLFFLISCSPGTDSDEHNIKSSPGKENRITAEKPPMGWNSYDCFGASVRENEVKGNADIMSVHLKDAGWEYIVIDYCWFYPYNAAMENPAQTESFNPPLTMDEYGRLLPALDKFPSAENGLGFKPIADYVHSKGLKFGIHVMRGIPRQAVAQNTPVYGSDYTAADIADTSSICPWLNSMYGVDLDKPGAQEYYNSLINLYAEWGVDYIKVDDISFPEYHEKEIEAIRKAIDQCGREIVFSLSPGSAPLDKTEHLKANANLWRISADFWDDWDALKGQFPLCEKWEGIGGKGHWPDADMLPVGVLNQRGPNQQKTPRITNFTRTEQKTMLTLWCIFRSPLMIGGDLMMMDNFTKSLLTNKAVLEVNQASYNNRQLYRKGDIVVWTADSKNEDSKYLALFNLTEEEEEIQVKLEDIGLNGECKIIDLWENEHVGVFEGTFSNKVLPHGSGLYKASLR